MILKYRIRRKTDTGTSDTLHVETETSLVLRPDGTTVENSLTTLENDSHAKNTVSKITSTRMLNFGDSFDVINTLGTTSSGHVNVVHTRTFVLPQLDDVKSALGISSGASSQYEIYPVGSIIKFDNIIWRCVHYDDSAKLLYLGAEHIESFTTFGSNNTYSESTLAKVAAAYQRNNISEAALSYCANITVSGVTSKVFVPSYEQVTGDRSVGGFTYFNTNSTRKCDYQSSNAGWWTSSKFYVNTDGDIAAATISNSYGFRPFIALQM